MTARPRVWPYAMVFVVLAGVWTFFVMRHYYLIWEATGEEAPGMSSTIRNGVLMALGLAVVAYLASFAWLHRSQSEAKVAAENAIPAATTPAPGEVHSMLTQSGPQFALEVRGLSFTIGRLSSDEVWQAVESKANTHESFRSQNPKDYADSADQRMTELGAAETIAFEYAVKHAVQRWPIPVFIWAPRKDASNSGRAAVDISDARQQAGLGASLFLWQDDANTADPTMMVEKLFAFFDAHPDVPQAILFSEDGSMLRSLTGTPGQKPLPQWEYIPEVPDSYAVMVVSRSDRVDRLIRPFATEGANANADNDKLWDYYWKRNDGQDPDGFAAYYRDQIKNKHYDHPWVPGTMEASWWQQQLPAFWKEISNKGPGDFKPTPYLPVRWTNTQLKQFDNAPLIGYLHRPVDVKLTDNHDQPLKVAEQAEALKSGWEQALATLPKGTLPKRVFYDTTGDRQWTIPLTQAFAAVGKTAPDLGNVHEGYDIGRRIADTGVSSTMVQMGLGLIAGYQDGATSATITRRPNGTATIIMVSPPSPEQKAAWEQSHGNANPFN